MQKLGGHDYKGTNYSSQKNKIDKGGNPARTGFNFMLRNFLFLNPFYNWREVFISSFLFKSS